MHEILDNQQEQQQPHWFPLSERARACVCVFACSQHRSTAKAENEQEPHQMPAHRVENEEMEKQQQQ